jgi:hypothetical protein
MFGRVFQLYKRNLEHQDFPDWFIEHTAVAWDLEKQNLHLMAVQDVK